MKNLLRGRRQKVVEGKVGEVEDTSVGREGCLCDLPDKGGSVGEAMGNPLGNPPHARYKVV